MPSQWLGSYCESLRQEASLSQSQAQESMLSEVSYTELKRAFGVTSPFPSHPPGDVTCCAHCSIIGFQVLIFGLVVWSGGTKSDICPRRCVFGIRVCLRTPNKCLVTVHVAAQN